MAPLLPPLQLTFVTVVDALSAVGWLMVADAVVVHPLLSVTVAVYVPIANPLKFWVVIPPVQE